jgi:hypothetical protein
MAIRIRYVEQEEDWDAELAVMYDAADDSRDCIVAKPLFPCEALGVVLAEGVNPLDFALGFYTEDERYFLANWIAPGSRLEAFMDWMLLTTGSLEYERLWPEFVEYERANLFDLYAKDTDPMLLRFGVRIDQIHEHAKTFDPDRGWMYRAIHELEDLSPEQHQWLWERWQKIRDHRPDVEEDED